MADIYVPEDPHADAVTVRNREQNRQAGSMPQIGLSATEL